MPGLRTPQHNLQAFIYGSVRHPAGDVVFSLIEKPNGFEAMKSSPFRAVLLGPKLFGEIEAKEHGYSLQEPRFWERGEYRLLP